MHAFRLPRGALEAELSAGTPPRRSDQRAAVRPRLSDEVADMFTRTRSHPVAGLVSRTPPVSALALAAVLAASLVPAGCDSNDPSEPEREIAAVAISPDSVSIEVGEQMDFSVVALTAAGDTVHDADLDIEWWSTDPEVFAVASGGVAIGQVPGAAYCVIEATDETAAKARSTLLRFTGRDSAFVRVLF